jgi:hypothetical protein
LHESVQCTPADPQEGGQHKTSLSLGPGTDEPRPDSATIRFEALSSDVQLIVDFARARGSAETCVYAPPDPFRELANAIRTAMASAEDRPTHLYVEKEGRYYEVSFQSADAVYVQAGLNPENLCP